MASGSQNMTTYNARIVTGSNSAASPAGALLLSGAGRTDDATGDTWIFLDSAGGTTNPWGIKHDQTNNKLQIFGSGTNSVSVRMNTGDTYILGKVGIGYDPETSGNTYKLYVDGTSYFTNNLTMNGGTITLWGERYSGNYGLDCNNSDIININSLRTADNAETYGEGLMFKNGSAWDCMAASDGKFYFRGGTDGTPSLSQANSNASLYAAYFYGDLKGNADTCTYPLGFSSRSTGVTWGNTTGTTITAWNDSAGGSCDWRMNNPSSGKMSLKVDGRFYGNEGTYPAMLMRNENSYWGLCDPDAANNVWIRTTTLGIIPYQSGGASAGHCSLGTSSWYFSTAYIQNIYGYLNGNISGSASKITDITSTDKASSSATWRRIWISYANNVTGRPAYTDKFAFQTSTGSMKTGRIHIWPADGSNSYNEGIRIHSSSNKCATIMLCADDNTGDTGTSTKSWGIFNNDGTLYINKATSSGAGNPRVYANANGWYFTKAYGAVWNDFAEYRKVELHEPGYAVAPSGHRTCNRLESGARITSDTYGYAIGYMEDREDLMPVAISGRVLAYPLYDKSYYEVGDAVCAAEGGKIDKMTREEIMMYPDRILGIVNEIPDYDIWEPSREGGGAEPIYTNGRIWIDIK